MSEESVPATSSRLLDGLDATQALAVESPHLPLAILAGAGSGKTRVLTRRIAHRAATEQLDPRYAVAVTFTRKAANELSNRLRALGMRDMPTTGTFHSLAYAQLRQRWAERGVSEPKLLDRKIGFIARLLPRRGASTLALDVTGELEWAAARALTPDRYMAAAVKADRDPPLPPEQIAEIFERYLKEKRRQRVVDFDDLLRLALRDLNADAEYAAAIRWRFRHLFVDEFQDINPLQSQLLHGWLGDRDDLTVVGDPNQSIYGWNGADAGQLLWFEDRYPGATVIRLGHNYRSTVQIVAAGHKVLPTNAQQNDPPQAHRGDGEPPVVRSFPTDRAEANGVARAVRDSHAPGTSWSSQAVLVRTNAQTVLIADALRSAGIPHRVRGGVNLVDQPEVRDMLSTLSQIERPLSEAVVDMRSEVAELSPGETASAADHDRHQNRSALLRLATDHCEVDPSITAAGFVAWVRATAKADGLESAGDAVEITTFHASKGLEWPVVHLAGLEKGYVPIGYAANAPQFAEEKRLLHVAITRAEHTLHLSWAQERTFGERTGKRTRSPYLDAIDPDGAPAPAKDPTSRRSANKTGVGQARGRIGELPPEAGGPVWEALASWRRETANENNVPAYIVFNNKTLAAIVEMSPSSAAELLDVPGIGPAKVERYGDAILEVLASV